VVSFTPATVEDLLMSAEHHHGNTPAAWTAVLLGLVGFVVGGIGLMTYPITWVVFFSGLALLVAAVPVFVVMDKLGLHDAPR